MLHAQKYFLYSNLKNRNNEKIIFFFIVPVFSDNGSEQQRFKGLKSMILLGLFFVPLSLCHFEPKKEKTNLQKKPYLSKNLTMKSKLIVITLLFSVFITSCDAVDDLLSFNISNSTSIKIQSNLPINLPSEIITPDVTTNSSAEFKNNKTKADLVKDVKIRSLKLTISDPSDKTFTFLKSIHLYISTTDSDEIELAYQDNINSTSNTIDLICTDARLDQYIKADKYKIRTKVTLKETLSKDVTVKAEMKFRVTADPF